MSDPQQIKQAFLRSRRLGLWLGCAAPALFAVAALLCSLNSLSPFLSFCLLTAALACCYLGIRAYRCPSCESFPEPDVPLFNPEVCCACKTQLR